ncbi:MAG: tyrosine-type recombinase/integrase [Fimbriimonadales bacterium]
MYAAYRFLRWCESEGLLPPIVREGDLPPPPPPQPNPMGVQELQRLLTAASQGEGWVAKRNHAVVATLLDAGVRRAELLQFKVRDGLAGVAVVKQKGNRFHRVYLSEATQRAIRAYIRAYTRETGRQLEPDDLLWRGVGGQPLSGDALRTLFRKLSQRVGERVYAHRLRSTSITLRLALGASTELVREAVGHADERSLAYYAKLAETDKARLLRETSPLNLLTGRKRRE